MKGLAPSLFPCYYEMTVSKIGGYFIMASHIIDEFIQALDEEITAIEKDKGVKVFNGRFLREVSGSFVI